MKKSTLFAVIAMAALSMTSCKKDRTCTCVVTSPGGSETDTYVITKATKKSVANGACASGTITASQGGVSFIETRTCTIK